MAIKTHVRPPNVAGSFYEADARVLRDNIHNFLSRAYPPPKEIAGKPIHALISPHAGYIYCGLVMAAAYRLLMGKSYDRVILLGPSHAVGFSSAALDCQRLWQTPIGTVPLDRNAIAQLSKFDGFEILPQVFDKEHSIEVQLPFLQTVLSDFSLIPICCGQDLPHKQIAEALETVRTNATLVIASSDFSHYHPEVEANKLDHLSVASILSQNPVFIQKNTDACGKEGIQILNSLARANRWKPVLLDYQTSGNITHDYSAVVGYASFAYV